MIDRVAYLSMHTSPLLQPGTADAGGMNVYIDELSRTMVGRGVAVDVFTRSHAPDLAPTVEVIDGYRVHHLPAGPLGPLPVGRMARHVRAYADAVIARLEEDGLPAIVHSHYWLSGWAGLVVKRELGIPLANSFHTLGRVKDLTRRADEPPESLLRIAAEHEVIEGSDCVVAATPLEAEDLMTHYRADPSRLCTSPPGVDHEVFRPGSRPAARRRLGWSEEDRVVLFVGRIQALKGLDVALEAFGRLHAGRPDCRLVVVGGPSGPKGEAEAAGIRRRAGELGLSDAVRFLAPVPHGRLADFYRAADVLVLPSRSESFGLVAAEAQACGLPVVAARVGGLAHVVDDGRSGLLVDGWDPADHAVAVARVLDDAGLARSLSEGAVEWSERFSWDATANRFLELYEGAVSRALAG